MDSATCSAPKRGNGRSVLFGAYHGATRNTDIYLVVSEDDSGGRLYLEADRIRISSPGAGSATELAQATELIHRAAAAQNGIFIPNPVWNRLTGNAVITGHPLGGCVMSDDAVTGVVNHKGEVYCAESGNAVHPGLLVVDGAVVSRSLGVNPLLRSTALAERSCAYFARERGWTISYELLPYLRLRQMQRKRESLTETCTTWPHTPSQETSAP